MIHKGCYHYRVFDIVPQLLVNSLITGSIYALAAAGLCLTFNLLRILNFAHGHVMMLGAYSFLLFNVELGYSLPVSALLSVLVLSGMAAIILGLFVAPFLRYSHLLPFVTTLALSSILEAAVSIGFGVNVRSLSIGAGGESWEFGGVYITSIQILIIASALAILTLMAFVVHYTAVGRKLRALAENRDASEALGIGARRLNFIIFILGVLLAAYAGVMVGYETNLQPTMGNAYTIKAFAAMILGGLGSIWGTVLGSYILGLVENFAIGIDIGGYSLPAGYKDAFGFVIILLVLLFRPQGLFATRARAS
jgi:branched-chain amino acid transport system permease protein